MTWIYDLDIGQNSLSLAADRGESIYFETDLIDQAATQRSVFLMMAMVGTQQM